MNSAAFDKILLTGMLILFSSVTCAQFATLDSGLGLVAANTTSNFTAVAKLITAGAYIGGLAFFIAAIMKFKQHKDNPTQIPIGTPIALVFIAGSLVFLPAILASIGYTGFATGGAVAGPTGISNILNNI